MRSPCGPHQPLGEDLDVIGTRHFPSKRFQSRVKAIGMRARCSSSNGIEFRNLLDLFLRLIE